MINPKTLSATLVRALGGTGLLLASMASCLNAELLVYEGFDYDLNESVEFKNGGIGWGGPWSWRNAFDGKGQIVTDSGIMEDGLSYENISTIGNGMHMYGDFGSLELGRRFAEVIPGTAGTRTYISLIGQRVGPEADPTDPIYDNPDTPEVEAYPWGDNLYPRGAAVRIFNSSNGEVMQIGNFSNQQTNEWSIFADGAHPSGVPFTDFAFVVVRIDHVGDELTADNIYMWVNPDLSAGEDTSTAQLAIEGITDNDEGPVDFSNLAWISPWVGNGSDTRPHAEMLLDEFRIGTTWEAVTPTGGTPDPTWGPFDIVGDGDVNTGGIVGWLNVSVDRDWVWSYTYNKFIYLPETIISETGSWIYFPMMEARPGGDWADYPVLADGYADTGTFLGWLNVLADPYIWSTTLDKFIYLPESYVSEAGAWAYVSLKE